MKKGAPGGASPLPRCKTDKVLTTNMVVPLAAAKQLLGRVTIRKGFGAAGVFLGTLTGVRQGRVPRLKRSRKHAGSTNAGPAAHEETSDGEAEEVDEVLFKFAYNDGDSEELRFCEWAPLLADAATGRRRGSRSAVAETEFTTQQRRDNVSGAEALIAAAAVEAGVEIDSVVEAGVGTESATSSTPTEADSTAVRRTPPAAQDASDVEQDDDGTASDEGSFEDFSSQDEQMTRTLNDTKRTGSNSHWWLDQHPQSQIRALDGIVERRSNSWSGSDDGSASDTSFSSESTARTSLVEGGQDDLLVSDSEAPHTKAKRAHSGSPAHKRLRPGMSSETNQEPTPEHSPTRTGTYDDGENAGKELESVLDTEAREKVNVPSPGIGPTRAVLSSKVGSLTGEGDQLTAEVATFEELSRTGKGAGTFQIKSRLKGFADSLVQASALLRKFLRNS
eukprot:INCI4319.1.p1 GENE.INCI4319.1~~INCI4319.1.p1  ORF type:complete len:448 (-),score=80.58 INCI4319.1:127-1470(-)